MAKYISLIVLFTSCFSGPVNAQVYEKTTVHAGANIDKISYFLFPAFANAAVTLKNDSTGHLKMNFNLLICQMEYINDHGDTLEITKPSNIASIAFDSTSFFYDNGYYQVIAAKDPAQLAVLRQVSYVPVKMGALGLPDRGGTGVLNFSSFLFGAELRKLTADVDADVYWKTTYFLIDAKGSMIKASKTAFMTLFSKYDKDIHAYLREHKINFNKENDLKKLFDYCASLQ